MSSFPVFRVPCGYLPERECCCVQVSAAASNPLFCASAAEHQQKSAADAWLCAAGVLPGLQMLSALLTTALCNALSDIGTAETQAEVTGLLSGLQNLLEGDGRDASSFKLESFLAALSRARSLRPGAEASSHLEKRAPRWQDHKDAVLKVHSRSLLPCFSVSFQLHQSRNSGGSPRMV